MIKKRSKSVDLPTEIGEELRVLNSWVIFYVSYLAVFSLLNVSLFNSLLSASPLTNKHHHWDDSIKTFILAHSNLALSNINGSDKFLSEYFLKRVSLATIIQICNLYKQYVIIYEGLYVAFLKKTHKTIVYS